jgi:hypothetical protein
VINLDDFLFTLVPQKDRRQNADRRAVCRGSRRAADQEGVSAMPAGCSASLLWAPPLDGPGPLVEKRMLH